MSIHDFFGSITPYLKYDQRAAVARTCSLPSQASFLIPFSLPLAIRKGSEVATGENIIDQGSFFSSVTGTVEGVEPFTDMEGALFQKVSLSVRPDEWTLSARTEEPFIGHPLLISCVDRDPVEQNNRFVLVNERPSFYSGLELLKKKSGHHPIFLTLLENDLPLIADLPTGLAETTGVPNRYPAGLPELLLERLGKLGRPTEGCRFLNADRVVSLAKATTTGQQPVDTTITLSGQGLPSPIMVTVRLGTRIADLLRMVPVIVQPEDRLIANGRFSGAVCYDTSLPIRPETRSLYIQAGHEAARFGSDGCINCGKCASVCPVGIEVNLAARYAEYALYEEPKGAESQACIRCGLCSFICPAQRPLMQLLATAAAELEKRRVH